MHIIDIPLRDIVINRQFRKALGNIETLAANIAEIGLLQPIGVNEGNELVFGWRRVAAYRHLGRDTIAAHVVQIRNIIAGTFAENEMREQFKPTERVAILKEMHRHQHGGDRRSPRRDQAEDFPLDRQQAAERAGLGNYKTASQMAQIADTGAPELIKAVDEGEITIDAGYAILNAGDHDEQRRIVTLPTKQRKETVSDLRSRPVKAKKRSARTEARPRRPQVEPMPLYRPTLTLEEQGFPPRDTWDEPDPDRPGLNRFEGHIAKHGHVHIMPLHVRQAQDNRIAARRLNSQVREISRKPFASFMTSDPPPMSISDFVATLDAMEAADMTDGAGTDRIIQRLSATLGEMMADITRTFEYLDALHRIIKMRAATVTQPINGAGSGECLDAAPGQIIVDLGLVVVDQPIEGDH